MFFELLSAESVTTGLVATTKDGVLAELSTLLGKAIPEVAPDQMRRVLAARESLASTGVGSGVAIPHGRIGGIAAIRVALATHARGVHFEAIDGQPVQIFVAVIAPDREANQHLRVLARASRLLRDESVRQRLIAQADAESLYRVFLEEDARL